MLFHRLSALVSSFISLLCQDLNWLVSESGFHLFSHLYLSQKGEQMLCDPRHSARHHCCINRPVMINGDCVMFLHWLWKREPMNGTRSLSRVYAVPAQRRENWRAAERHNTPSFSFFCLHDSASRSQLHLSHSYFCPSTWRRLSGTSWVSEKRRSSPFSSCLDQLSQVVSRCRTAHFSNKMPW